MFKSEALGPAARFQSIGGMCCTCLAADRQLLSLHKTPQFVNICIGLALSKDDVVCYECRARLYNFVKFRSRALRAKTMLSRMSPRCLLQPTVIPDIKCLSTLAEIVISPNNTIYIDGDLVQVKVELSESEVKEEWMTTAEPLIEPLHTLINDRLKTDRRQYTEDDSMSDSKPVLDDDDDGKMDMDPMGAETKSHKEHIDFIVNQIDHSEVLSYFDKERNSQRFKRAPYKCVECALPFLTHQKLRNHKTLHSEKQGPLQCEVCKQRFMDSAALKLHTDSHYRIYGCRHCTRTDRSYSKMHNHYKKVHDDTTPRACRKCPARFTRANDLRTHVRTEHDKYMCKVCDRRYTSKLSLERHTIVSHTKVRLVECGTCHKKYKGEANLKIHIRKVHVNSILPRENAYCAECNVQFKDPYQYRQHLKSSKHVPPEAYKYECDYCNKRFTQKNNLRVHMEEQHLKLSRYPCVVCNERFNSRLYAARHTRLKHSGKPRSNKHVCHICAKAFAIRKSLDDHMNTHLGIRPYECKLCGATFVYSAALYNHNQQVHMKRKVGKKRKS